MTSYLYHETMTCDVTFVRRIEADNEEDALDAAMDGGGTLLGVSVGDTVPGVERSELKGDNPVNIPAHFYSEPDGPGWFTVWVSETSGQGTQFVQAFKASSIEDAKQRALEECAACWGQDLDDLFVLGVAEGDVKVLEWNDDDVAVWP